MLFLQLGKSFMKESNSYLDREEISDLSSCQLLPDRVASIRQDAANYIHGERRNGEVSTSYASCRAEYIGHQFHLQNHLGSCQQDFEVLFQ
jgi:hypothetical protein